MSKNLRSKKARIIEGTSAWWYDERGGISVYIRGFGTLLSCTIKRSALLKFIERSKKK